MIKLKRNERIGAMMKILGERPNQIIPLKYFTEKFSVAKSTISEDLKLVRLSMEKTKLGQVKTISGASGGAVYIPMVSREETREILEDISGHLINKDRILPGGFLYMTDIIYLPRLMYKLGKVMASQFNYENVDYIITVETKGIPLALMVARTMNLPLVILRKDNKVTEGSTVSINYISGTSGKIQKMSLSRRAIAPNSRVIIIDDFMKAGGTAKGMMDMMKEFDTQVEGIGVFISTRQPEKKLVEEYTSLLILEDIEEEEGLIKFTPNSLLTAEK